MSADGDRSGARARLRALRDHWLALAALQTTALAVFAWRNLGAPPYDDAYFFKRFALHALRAGRLSWNLDEPPVYGATSQLWQALAVALTALAPSHFVLASKLLSLLCAALAAALLARTSFTHDRGSASAFALSSPAIAYALLSGMETGLTLALLAACVSVAARERTGVLRGSTPVAALLVYLARPDAVLLALAILLAGERDGRRLRTELALSGAAILAWSCAAKLYYGTALPLPFYAKTAALSPYDPEFLAQCRRSNLAHLALFALAALPLGCLAGTRLDRINAVLLVGVGGFAGYHTLLAVDVMGMHARFYAPALVPLVWAAARGLAASETLEPPRARAIGNVAAVGALLALGAWLARPDGRSDAVAGGVLLVHVWAAAILIHSARRPHGRALGALLTAALCIGAAALSRAAPRLARLDDQAYLSAHVARGTVFRGIDTLIACFGDGIHVYHSEAGVPGLLLAHGKVTDLAGLLSPQWLFRREGFDAHCLRDQPDAIFLPHRNYRALNREIAASRCLRGYVRVIERSASPLHVRADLAPRYRACRAARAGGAGE